MNQRSSIEFEIFGRTALFTDPLTRLGGDKFSYDTPTYEALKGIARGIYWTPTFNWVIDELRVLRLIRRYPRCVSTSILGPKIDGKSLAIYTTLCDVHYQVKAHFEWNKQRPDLMIDRSINKHISVARRMLEKGGRKDVFLGTRDCQGYVRPCMFGAGPGDYDNVAELDFGIQFHGFDYPSATEATAHDSRFWQQIMHFGVVKFIRPDQCELQHVCGNAPVDEDDADETESESDEEIE